MRRTRSKGRTYFLIKFTRRKAALLLQPGTKMIFKLRQKRNIHRRNMYNELPNLRAQKFLLNYLRQHRVVKTSGAMRASLGLIRYFLNKKRDTQNRIGHRAACFITGRARGLTQRFGVARTKIKFLADTGLILGVRKSSW